MPARLIRDDMLDSERVQTLPIEARWLYLAILLTADDVGLFEASAFKLARRAGLDSKAIPTLMQLLADADLVRVYEAEGKRFGFIPRFRQRLQIKRTRHPMPPGSLMSDDLDAINKINDLSKNPPLDNRGSRKSTAAQPPEPEPEPEEEKRVPTVLVGKADAYAVPSCPFELIVRAYHELCPSMTRVRILTGARQKHTRARWVDVCTNDRWNQTQALEFFRWYFARAEASDFLSGRKGSGRVWRADFEWLMTQGNWAKVIEGKYHGENA